MALALVEGAVTTSCCSLWHYNPLND